MLILKLSEEDEEENRVTTCIMTLRWFRNQNLEVERLCLSLLVWDTFD